MLGATAIDRANASTRTTAKSESIRKTAATLLPRCIPPSCCPWYQTTGTSGPEETSSWHGEKLPIIGRGRGGIAVDVDGNEYVDLIGGHGTLILGHADERVVAAISKAASKGNAYGQPSEMEVRLAELIAGRVPSVDMVHFVHTTFDALAFAVRAARAFTKRRQLVTFEGTWSNEVRRMRPDWSIPPDFSPDQRCAYDASRFVLPFNDVAAAEGLFRDHGSDVAAVVVEPVCLGKGLVQPADSFLSALRLLCDIRGSLLVFDETVTGFRVVRRGVPSAFDVLPDLTLLGPVVGGGLPLAACGGRKEVFRELCAEETAASLSPRYDSPSESVLALAAGIATLQAVGEDGFYEELEARSVRLDEGLCAASSTAGVSVRHSRVASILGLSFVIDTAPADGPADSSSEGNLNSAMFTRFLQEMLDRGVLLPPSPVACLFVSAAHSNDDIDRALDAAHAAFRTIVR